MKTRAFRPRTFDWYHYAIDGGPIPEALFRPIEFLRAGDELVNVALQNRMVDRLFYPSCFCYAHFAESVVKYLLVQMRELVTVLQALGHAVSMDEEALKAKRQPGLKELSLQLKSAFETATSEKFEETVLLTLTALEDIEPIKRKVRKKAKRGKVTVAIQQVYDLEHIKEQMRTTSAFLLGMVNWIDAQIDEGRTRLKPQRKLQRRLQRKAARPAAPRRKPRTVH